MKCALSTLTLALLVTGLLTEARSQATTPDLFQELHWRNIGPFRGGRTRAAAGVAGQPHVFYMAQVNGGVWKTDDAGRTWQPIFDAQPSQSVGAIAVAPSNPEIVYVASGEGLRRPDLSVGDGIYKSLDGGATWQHLGLRDGQQIPALAIDPHNPDRVFAAVLGHPYGPNAERGIFRSIDGGATWTKVLFVDENTGGSDVCLDPSNPQIVYASLWESRLGPWDNRNKYEGTHGGLFKSSDGGQTWRKLTQGLPADLVQIQPAVAPSDPRRIYAAVGAPGGGVIYRSDDAGESWARATTDLRPALAIGGGDLPVLRVDPTNPDLVYSATVVAWRSTDGAKTWSALKGAPGGDDYQNLWINPLHPEIILMVSDQGAVVTLNSGRTWSSWYNQPTAQLYHVSTDRSFPYRVYSGQQESGSVGIASRGNDGFISFRDWHPVGASEYGYVAPDPLDPNIVYGAGRLEVSKFHWDTGQVEMVSPAAGAAPGVLRAVRTQPIMFSPVDPHVLYYAANILFQTTDGGHSWRAISPDLSRPAAGIPPSVGPLPAKAAALAAQERGVIYALAPSPLDLPTIWAGTDDGLMWLTTDGGAKWHDVTPPELTPWSKVTQIDASHFHPQSAYISVSRFRVDDLKPYIYRTRDGGRTWQLITTGLPNNAPINTVREDPVRPGLLFAGSETGVWTSLDDGDHWQSLQLNLPHTSMRDLCIHDADLIVATHGRSFWILDDLTPLRQYKSGPAPSSATLFQPAPVIRVRLTTNTDTPLPPDEPVGENPPDGAVMDYLLRDAAPGKVTLEITNHDGKLVRRYSDRDGAALSEKDRANLPIPAYWVPRLPTLPSTAGLHRWIWDLHYTPPDSLRHDYPIAAVFQRTPRLPRGPRALPGQYQIKLTVGDRSYTAPLVVTMDPRVRVNAADLQSNFTLQTQLAAIISHSTKAIRTGRSLLEQIANRTSRTKEPLPSLLGEFQSHLQNQLDSPAGESRPSLTEINRDAFESYGSLDSADAAPTAAQIARAAKLGTEFQQLQATWDKLLTGELPALNRQLKLSALPELTPDRQPDSPDEAEAADLD